MLRVCLYLWLLCALPLAYAHEGHDHASPLAVSVAFDANGQLWRVGAKEGFVWVDSSKDLGKSFGSPIKINSEPQKIGLEGDARPKIAIGAQGQIYLTWTQALPKPYTGYIWFARSLDGGKSFEPAYIVHQDRAEITHRFDALSIAATGRIYVAWVDKRDLESAKAKQKAYAGAAIYYAISDDQGKSFKPEQKLADNSCECCRIALATQADGQAVAMWRHLFAGGIRDHAMARFSDAPASELHRASFGNWKIDACPHHGPAIVRGIQQNQPWGWHMAWFDGGAKTGLFYARMDDVAWVTSPAKRFGDSNQQAGHPALLSLDRNESEQVWLVWKELNNEGSFIKLALSNDGGRSWNETRTVASNKGSSDYAQLLQWQGQVYLVWNTEQGLVVQKLGAEL